MKAADALIGWLERGPALAGTTVVSWRIEVVQGDGIRAGIRDSLVGGPYEGPGMAARLAGSLELHWSDGLVTRAGLDRQAVVEPAVELEAWRSDAVGERSGRLPPLAGPARLPEVNTFDATVAEAGVERAELCLRTLQQLHTASGAGGVGRVDAVMRVSRGERTVATSRGFRADWRETSCSIDLWADEIAGAAYARRCLPTDADLDRLAREVSTLATSLRSTDELPALARGVLFLPHVVQELIGRFVVSNLSGRSIRDGRSPFSLTDLEMGRRAIREDLDLTIDTTLPFELASAPCSPEGVPAGRVSLIAAGRLLSPTLDLATAAELNRPPTPTPRGRPGAVLSSTLPEIGLNEALELLGDGVVIRDLPGLHTQPVRRAAYALVAPDGQAVVGGAARGRCAVRLAGRMLDHLTQPSTRLVRIPGELHAGLLVLSGVELLPA